LKHKHRRAYLYIYCGRGEKKVSAEEQR